MTVNRQQCLYTLDAHQLISAVIFPPFSIKILGWLSHHPIFPSYLEFTYSTLSEKYNYSAILTKLSTGEAANVGALNRRE